MVENGAIATSFIQLEPLAAYLEASSFVDHDAPSIAVFAGERLRDCEAEEAARRAFHFVRDDVSHSWDIQGRRVTRSASDVLRYREGICYPKSHLLAAFLRHVGIPTAICYQRLTLLDDDSAGYAVHALNAVYLGERWHRIDARGNKPGIDAQFTLDEERLAFPIRSHYSEIDYMTLHASPHPAIMQTLARHDDALEMYRAGLPTSLQ